MSENKKRKMVKVDLSKAKVNNEKSSRNEK